MRKVKRGQLLEVSQVLKIRAYILFIFCYLLFFKMIRFTSKFALVGMVDANYLLHAITNLCT